MDYRRTQSAALVPIGWVAVGNPAEVLAPNEHEKIWVTQNPRNAGSIGFSFAIEEEINPANYSEVNTRFQRYQIILPKGNSRG